MLPQGSWWFLKVPDGSSRFLMVPFGSPLIVSSLLFSCFLFLVQTISVLIAETWRLWDCCLSGNGKWNLFATTISSGDNVTKRMPLYLEWCNKRVTMKPWVIRVRLGRGRDAKTVQKMTKKQMRQRQTDGPTDEAGYRFACTRLKREYSAISISKA